MTLRPEELAAQNAVMAAAEVQPGAAVAVEEAQSGAAAGVLRAQPDAAVVQQVAAVPLREAPGALARGLPSVVAWAAAWAFRRDQVLP